MKNSLLGIVSVVLCALLAWKYAESAQLQQRIANLEAEVATWKATQSTTAQQLASKPAAEPSSASAPDQSAPAEDKKADQGMAKAMASVMDSPDAKKAMQEGMKTVLDEMNKDLYELLGLSPEQKEKLQALIVEQAVQQQALGMKMMTGGSSKEARDGLFKAIKDQHEEGQKAIKDLLQDPAKIAQYEQFQDSAPERQQLSKMKSKLATDGTPLNETQEQGLMNLLFSERKAMKWDHDYTKQQEINPDYFTTEALDRQAEQVSAYDANIDAKLVGLLSPEQITAFQAQRTSQHAMEKMGVQFMKAMFGGKKGE